MLGLAVHAEFEGIGAKIGKFKPISEIPSPSIRRGASMFGLDVSRCLTRLEKRASVACTFPEVNSGRIASQILPVLANFALLFALTHIADN